MVVGKIVLLKNLELGLQKINNMFIDVFLVYKEMGEQGLKFRKKLPLHKRRKVVL
jgi:hypothetical protein